MEQRKTRWKNRRLKHAIVDISFPYTFITMYPISVTQGFPSFVTPCFTCNSTKESKTKTQTSNIIIALKSTSTSVCMHTKLDNRNAISIRNKKANTKWPIEMKQERERKKIGAIFCCCCCFVFHTSV